jgi:hypothetical protein
MATAEQLAAFQTAVASGNIQEAANIAASAGYSPQQVAEYVNANAPVLGLGPETGFSGVTAANLDPYFAAASAPVVAAPPPPVVVQEQGDPLKGALALYDQYLLAGQYPEAKALLDSTIATYGLNPTESYANMATYLNTDPKFEGVRETAGNKLFTSENIANFGKLSPAASVGPAGGIYQRTPEQQAAYESQLASIPVNTAIPLPVMPMSLGPSAAMARIQRTGEMTPEQYYSNIRETVSGGQYTPAQLRQMQQNVGTSGQDINVAFGRGMTPIGQLQPGARDVSVDIPGQFVTEDGGQPKPLSVDISSMPKEQQDLTKFIVGKLPRPTTTSPSMFSPENVRAQLELERLKAMNAPRTTDQEPVAGFAQGGLVSDDINRMLQNQRNAIQRESQSRQMLNTLGAPPVKKFSDGGPAGSSSGVRRLKMSGYQEGGEVTDEMFTGTLPTDQGTSPGILPPELREAIDVPLDFANLLIRGTAAVPIGGAAGLYKGLTGGKYGTQEGVKEADTEAARMMAKITGEPKTQTAKDVLQFVGDKMQEYKLDAALPQLLTLPSPGAGTTEFIKQAVRSEFEAPPVGAVDIGALMPKPKKGVELSEQEVGKLVDSSQVSDEQAPALVETARRVKEIFNTNQGWEPMELIRAKIKPGKKDNLAVDLEAQKIPYNFHIVPEGMAKPAWEKKISNGIVGEVRKVVERAKAGDQKALDILGQASWYRSMRKRLRTEFGSIGDVFADVLGTTSAQTGVEQNFNNAIEILRRYSRGDYDKELKAYEDRLKSGESMDGTELTQLHKKGEFPLITKASGALFNANSPSSMGALLDMFRSVRTGDSPKTPNFTGNLIGLTNEATVDVWAARLLRRLSGKKRIPPMAEKGVSGKHLVGSTLYEPKVGGEFGFGQKVFKDAANRINKTGVIKNFDPNIGDVGPDDLQAIAWFIEKERWTDNGWTSKAGEGGSLEYEMSFAGAPNQAMVNDLRREINKGFKEPPQRKKESDQDHALRVEAAQQAYDVNRQNLINQLALLKKDVDRYQIGLSGERPGKPLASGYQRAELAAGVDDVVRDDQNVIAYNLTNSYGSFMSEVERALNGEFVVRGNFDPIPLERRVVELGKEYDQDAVFLSKVLPDGQSANARPGIEIYFKEKVSPEQMAKVTERLRNYGVDGFTYVTDMRFSDRPGMQVRAGSPETAELTGLRFQYVPEFDDAYSPETRGAIIKEKERLYREILRGIITDGNVSDARMLYYDTKVFLKGGYDEYLARTTPGGSGRVRPGQPDSSDTARSAQGAAVGAELSGDVRDGRDQATRAPAAEGVKRRRGKGTTSAAEDLAAVSPTAPAVSRVDMGYKDVTKRVPELTKGANDLLEGKITWEDYNALVDQYKPVTPYSFVPAPATAADAMKALDSRKQKSFAVIQEGIKAGETAELRLDIPAYKDHGVWVNSIHRSGQPTSYASISSIKNARMIGPDDVRLQEKALEVATGQKSKGPFAVIKGEWSPVSEKEAVARAQQYLNDPEWTQVGYDPERHSYFYDRTTTRPVVSADEVLQIGPLVLAKNAKFAKKEQFKFKDGGEVDAFIKAKAR